MTHKARLAIFASGNGTNAEAIFHYFKNHDGIRVSLLLSNNPQAYVLERAKKNGIDTVAFTKIQFRESDEIVTLLKETNITHIVLAGFLWLVPDNLIKAFPNRIINIHPALLPKHGGKGMYGMNVHRAVKAEGDNITGITIHNVNERYDEGVILFQATCDVLDIDSPEEIANKVHQLEHDHYPHVIEKWIGG